MAKGGYHPLTKDDLKERLKELQERIVQFDRREKAVGDLRKWLSARKLDYTDLLQMYRKLKPKRPDAAPVKSRQPLHAIAQRSLKNARKRATGNYMVSATTTYRGKPDKIKYLSPDGQYVWGGIGRKPPWAIDFLKRGGTMDALLLNPKPQPAPNGSAAHP